MRVLTETGRVVAIEADGVWVETIRQSTCGSCTAQKGCGHGLLNRLGDGRRGYVRVLPGKLAVSDCNVDDQVRISLPEQVILRGSMILYVVPLVTMLAGAAGMGSLFPHQPDAMAALGAASGLGLGLLLVRWHGWRHRHDQSLQPTLVEVLGPRAEAVRIG